MNYFYNFNFCELLVLHNNINYKKKKKLLKGFQSKYNFFRQSKVWDHNHVVNSL